MSPTSYQTALPRDSQETTQCPGGKTGWMDLGPVSGVADRWILPANLPLLINRR